VETEMITIKYAYRNYQIFNPEIPGLEPPNTGISGLRKMPEIRDWNP
jgi:hypothetical protein